MSHAQQHVLASAIVLALIVVLGIHVFLFPMYSSNPRIRRIKFSEYEQPLCHTNLKNVRIPVEWKNQCPKYGIVSAVQAGRLGNQIWEYASVWAIARRTGLEAFMPRCILKTLEEHFEHLSIPPLSYIGQCTLDGGQVVNSLDQWNSTEQSIILPKYAAHWSIVLDWLEDVRREFTFKPKLRMNAEIVLKEAAQQHNLSDPTFVGIHVRRTDYIDYLWKTRKVRAAPVSFYHAAMDHYERKYRNVVFIVASDNIGWCKYNLKRKKSKINFISEPDEKGPGKDLAILSSCNHSIIDYGTYGSWGAILAAGETVVFNVTEYFSTLMAEVLPNWRVMG
ncbi:galactoside 2-alpha-L-fucosyltransferase Sec1 [Neodiprion pinetum]|uniref:L-Fucosyltransferase n=1 Tax=Neodiprion lecontei TaxID=441921 RepID=A0A6J0BGD1_NEOLC|nr:galactoside 2-alpha-L-fucosyltransferase Sec1 [Neodiprion lecontei]XP_015513873.1 galactoside 2-alpha-L-fucosyltransferase Sec1 [Neodiprion lecontei]XP_046487435.1 galactoside 2-alpha-L-fucosyltransferase Sec1-like [Neodiprion pinetum]XP_046487436.1 galactoside 2-alpha-L-fucosyltransferase Sec1-like [Neodiprion pinetum]XP_046487437.1 galactoside 2-alpha-L-fucosyltransferase Sec1-like [Neodiprion pinetum]XP_046598985.1 galactoside 2-alpha-L-fucosyltransferase Sec1 [Neodiprion lecontei]